MQFKYISCCKYLHKPQLSLELYTKYLPSHLAFLKENTYTAFSDYSHVTSGHPLKIYIL